jgi:hypothetical protein
MMDYLKSAQAESDRLRIVFAEHRAHESDTTLYVDGCEVCETDKKLCDIPRVPIL